jgi:amino acid adenylation domain-containing protein
MNTKEFINYLYNLDIKLYLNGSKLGVDAPKGVLNSQLQTEIASRKSAIIHYLRKQENITLKPIDRQGDLPLYFAQLRSWFFEEFVPNTGVYNITRAIKMEGNLDVIALEKTVNEIIKRHEVLRSSCENVDGKPKLNIAPQLKISLPITDLSHLSPENQTAKVEEIAQQEAHQPFDLSIAPLLRVNLLRLNPQKHILLLNLHHFVADGWSMPLLYQELSQLYQAFSQDLPSPLPDLPIQYVDFASWQQRLFEAGYFDQQLSYWKQQLKDSSFVLDLPTDKPRPAIQTYDGDSYSFQFPLELSQKINQLCREKQVTPFMLLLAVFQILLYRYSNQEDLIVATTVSNRKKLELENIIGAFANNILLRAKFKDDLNFTDFLQQIKQTTISAYAHQDFPFEKLVEELQPPKDLSRNPLYQVWFILHERNSHDKNLLQKDNIIWNKFDLVKLSNSRMDLGLSFISTNDQFEGCFEYNINLFNGDLIQRMAQHFQVLLSEIVKNLQEKISRLNILTKTEKQQILIDWNRTKVDYPKDKCIHQLFEEQVIKTPDNIAVIFEDEKLTYQQLNEKANQLAHYLIKQGVKPETIVGIFVERSLEMIIGILGILKAGGAYIPLDVKYPQARIKFMLEDSQASIILTQEKLINALSITSQKIVNLDNWELIKQENKHHPLTSIKPNNLVYIIYTSGTTGKPKGVQIIHQSLTNYLYYLTKYFKLQKNDTFLAVANISFDVAMHELFLPLIIGGKLIIASDEMITEPSLLLKAIKDYRVTIIDTTPSRWQILVEMATEQYPLSISKIWCGGESLNSKLACQLTSITKDVYNFYGPTETTIFSLIYPVTNPEKILIGKAIANTKTYILDSNLQPLPIGVVGELHIGGDGLARGYLNRPDLTAEKFIDNPFGEGKLYKTGDLARYLPDGNIEYIGRIDNQVKIRGFRIELGEIEATLNQYQGIKETVVIVRENSQGDKYLVAYLITNNQVNQKELRAYIQKELPEYMIPSAFIFLDGFPLNHNGKIDRKALPEPDFNSQKENEFIAPRNEIEIKLVQIWQEVLGKEQISINDNFFELGGHSLLAVRLVFQIEQQLLKKLSISSLFQNPTIEKLSQLITSSDKTDNSAMVCIKPNGKKNPVFCIHPGGGNVFCYAELAHYLNSYDIPVYGLKSLGLDDEQQPLTSIGEMAEYYLEAIQRIQPQGEYHLIGWSLGGVIAFEIAQQLQAKGYQTPLLALIDSQLSIASSLDQDKMFKFFVQDLSRIYGKQLLILEDDLQKLTIQEKFNYLLAQIEKEELILSEYSQREIKNLWRVFQGNLMALNQYKPKSYLGEAILFQASEKSLSLNQKQYNEWNNLILGNLDVHTLKGNHYTIIKSPTLENLVQIIITKV